MPSLATKLDIPFKPGEWYEVVAPCDGLVLLSDNERNIWLINPTTRATRAVPYSPFAPDPRASISMYGLGYDEVGDDYKVVSLSYYDTDNEHEPDCTEMFVSVFSVKTGAWKKVESSPYDHAVGHVTSGVFVGGFVHWLASKNTYYASVIAAFSLLDEKFYEVPPPSSVDGRKFVFDRLAVLGGCLCMALYGSNKETDVWVMKEYGVQESWTKFTIVEPERAEFKPLCLLEKERVVLIKDEETADEKLVIYDVKEGTMKEILVNGIPGDFQTGGAYVESLVSPDWCHEAGNE